MMPSIISVFSSNQEATPTNDSYYNSSNKKRIMHIVSSSATLIRVNAPTAASPYPTMHRLDRTTKRYGAKKQRIGYTKDWGCVIIKIPHHSVIQSEAKDLNTLTSAFQIFRTESSTTHLPPCGRLNDRMRIRNGIIVIGWWRKSRCRGKSFEF